MKWLTVMLVFASVASAAPTTQRRVRPSGAIGQEGCVRTECHANIRNYALLHGPVSTNACDACHEPVDVEAHTFRLSREKAELCTYCHEFDVSRMPVVHKPVAQGECLGCHDPHGGWNHQLLREASVPELCGRCHESITRGRSFLHTPVAKGACESCHPPHAARFAKLLDLQGTDLCLTCHVDLEAGLQQAKLTHKALEKGCEKCHDVHGSNHAMATTQPVGSQCAGCHEPITLAASIASHKHPPMGDERACIHCHSPHHSSAEKLVTGAQAKSCAGAGCHAKEIKSARGEVIAAVPDPSTISSHVHGALKNGQCSGCHTSHGGNRGDLLTKFYSTRFYQRFSVENYELCSSCHDARLFTAQTTTIFTAFRNGDQNLHALHVKLQGERSENCRVCHVTHFGGDDRGIRERIRYGKWDMPMRFSRTSSGGGCFPGCHPRYAYDRERPVKNTPTTQLVRPIPRVAAAEPASIELRVKNLAGKEIRIPDATRPTVLLFVRNIDTSLDAVSAIAPPHQLAIIATAASTPYRFPIVPDGDGYIASQLHVRAWPTAVVIGKDGMELARISGSMDLLMLKLERYLDAANGGRPQMHPATTRSSDVRLVERSAASRELFDAERYIAARRFAEAKAILARVLAQGHNAPRAHFLMGEVLAHEGDWEGAALEYRAAR